MLKSKVKKAEPTVTDKAVVSKKNTKVEEVKKNDKVQEGCKGSKEIQEIRSQIEVLRGKEKALLTTELFKTNKGYKEGMTVYYPAPPQKKVIPCLLEVEYADNEVLFYARPMVEHKGVTSLSKRHYSLGTDLSKVEGLAVEAPKVSKAANKTEVKASAKAVSKKDTVAEVTEPAKKKMKLGKKKK